jgi:hypothetical protein
MSSNSGINEPSKLRIRIPTAPYINDDAECTDEVLEERQAVVPIGWHVVKSRKTGLCYYVNNEQGISQWEFPGREALTGGSRKYKKQRKQRKKSKTIKRRK